MIFGKGMLDPELIALIEQFPDECADWVNKLLTTIILLCFSVAASAEVGSRTLVDELDWLTGQRQGSHDEGVSLNNKHGCLSSLRNNYRFGSFYKRCCYEIRFVEKSFMAERLTIA